MSDSAASCQRLTVTRSVGLLVTLVAAAARADPTESALRATIAYCILNDLVVAEDKKRECSVRRMNI